MKVYYIDPQSYNNLSTYDYALLSHVGGHDITYYHSDLYQHGTLPVSKGRCYFSYSSKKNKAARTASYVRSILRIMADALRERPDVIHIQWIKFWPVDYLFARTMRRAGIRVLFTAHNVLPHVHKASDFRQYRRYYGVVSGIIVHSKRTKEELIGLMGVPEDKVSVIFHGVLESNVCREEVEKKCQDLREALAIRQGDVVFSCLGVQKPYKGTELVIRTWLEHAEFRDNPHFRLLIVGKNFGIDYAPLRQCRNVFVLDEMIPDLDFEAYIRLSSVLLLPYLKISQSGLLFSAVCHHVPVLVSDIGGLTEPLEFGKIGWSMGQPSAESLARTMLWLARHPGEIEATRKSAGEFEKVRRAYGWEAIGEATARLYASAHSHP